MAQSDMRCASSPPRRNVPHMTDSALATTDKPAPPVKEQRIPPRIRRVVDLIVTGECETQKAAAARVGLHPDYVGKALKKQPVRVFIERRSRETIANGMMRASARLNQLVDASSEHVSLDATKYVLGIAGIKPSPDTQVSVNIELKAGYVIDLREPEPMRVINAEVLKRDP
jgi:hypothetical protein